MKKTIVLAAMMFACMLGVAQEKIQWMDFEEAVSACQKNPKMMFIDVYTTWCGWCTKMDNTTFTDPQVVKYMNENFYPVKLNAERPDAVTFQGREYVNVPRSDGRKGSHQLAAALLNNKMSYPSYVILNDKMQRVQVIPGYQEAKNFLPMLHFFGEGAYNTTPWAEFMEEYSKRSAVQK